MSETFPIYNQKGDDHLPSGEELNVAMWGMKEKAREEREGIPSGSGPRFVSPVEILTRALVTGDHAFIRKVAETMELLEEQGWTVDAAGAVVRELRSPQTYIVDNWTRWEESKAPVKERIEDLSKNGFGISRETYYRIVKATGHVSDEAPPV